MRVSKPYDATLKDSTAVTTAADVVFGIGRLKP